MFHPYVACHPYNSVSCSTHMWRVTHTLSSTYLTGGRGRGRGKVVFFGRLVFFLVVRRARAALGGARTRLRRARNRLRGARTGNAPARRRVNGRHAYQVCGCVFFFFFPRRAHTYLCAGLGLGLAGLGPALSLSSLAPLPGPPPPPAAPPAPAAGDEAGDEALRCRGGEGCVGEGEAQGEGCGSVRERPKGRGVGR